MKRKAAPSVMAIHDLSCVGRCALTVALPTLAAMGAQPVPLPTAVLSTHTGGYTDIAARDLSGFMGECLRHWKELGLRFDAIYSGYLAGFEQVELAEGAMRWQADALKVIDPVMGDEGRLYGALPEGIEDAMRELCSHADVITPNLTELSLLCRHAYSEKPRSEAEAAELAREADAKCVMLTSLPLEDGRYANVCCKRGERGAWLCAYEPVPAHYPGTGDLFASAVTGYLLRGLPPERAMAAATAFLSRVICDSHETDAETRAGVQLERALPLLFGDAESAPLKRI